MKRILFLLILVLLPLLAISTGCNAVRLSQNAGAGIADTTPVIGDEPEVPITETVVSIPISGEKNDINDSRGTSRATVTSITVSTPQELIDAVAPDTCITIKAGVYDFSTVTTTESRYAEAGSGTAALMVSCVEGLTLQAEPGAYVELVTPHMFSEVLKFSYCNGIKLSGITAGHTVTGKYECDAGVVWFEDSDNITIEDCLFYGCGAIGIRLWNCSSAQISDTTVTDCSLRAVDIWCGINDNIVFTGCRFVDNRAYGCVIFGTGYSIAFIDCVISGNKSLEWSCVEFSGEVLFERCIFSDNANIEGTQLVFAGNEISLRDCEIEMSNFSGYWSEHENYGVVDLGGNILR